MFLQRQKSRLIAIAGLLTAFVLIGCMIPAAQTSYTPQNGRMTVGCAAVMAAEPDPAAPSMVPGKTATFAAEGEVSEISASYSSAPAQTEEAPAPATTPEEMVNELRRLETEADEQRMAKAAPVTGGGINTAAWLEYHDAGYYAPGEGGTLVTEDGDTLSYKRVISCSATAYTTELQQNKITATGTVAHVGGIAVDPKVIPYGTRMYIVSASGAWCYGYAVAEDCGGGIKGNKVDLFFDTYDECISFGVRDAVIYILE